MNRLVSSLLTHHRRVVSAYLSPSQMTHLQYSAKYFSSNKDNKDDKNEKSEEKDDSEDLDRKTLGKRDMELYDLSKMPLFRMQMRLAVLFKCLVNFIGVYDLHPAKVMPDRLRDAMALATDMNYPLIKEYGFDLEEFTEGVKVSRFTYL